MTPRQPAPAPAGPAQDRPESVDTAGTPSGQSQQGRDMLERGRRPNDVEQGQPATDVPGHVDHDGRTG